MFRSLGFGFVLLAPLGAAEPLRINLESTTYDYYPTAAADNDGTTWLAWHGYRNRRDQIFARQVSARGELSPLETISQGGRVHGMPVIIPGSNDNASVIWASMKQGRWQILIRRRIDQAWRDSVILSDSEYDGILPTAVALDGDRLVAAWCRVSEDRFDVHGCVAGRDGLAETFAISGAGGEAVRSTLVTRGDQVWAVWDQYENPNYSVHARQVYPQRGPIERVSPPGQNCLKPVALEHAGGLIVAWLKKQDVIGGPGVISQLHTLHAARRGAGQWTMITSPEGDATAAELTHGLMAKIEPKPVPTGGYLGPRTRPMLRADGDLVWLLWERKSNHRGGTPTVSGQLCGRPIENQQWAAAKVLATDRVDYHVIEEAQPRPGTFRLLASQLPAVGLRAYEVFDIDLADAQPLQQEEWIGWSPVKLPIESERARPARLRVDGKNLTLYWADLHCHNGLTADAEGEPDELHWYARERAVIDVVAFTNNDFYNVPLTQYEYELGVLMSRVFSAKREKARLLLSLPGFEWTSRIPGVRDVPLSNPGNWMPPYQHRSYPNHRSVIYPASGGPLVHFTEVGNDIARLNQAVERAGGITLSQHNAFKLSGHKVEVGLELTSGWSNYIARRAELFHQPLREGRRLAFTASGDTHRRAPGLSGALTGIYAESNSPEAILDALRAGRCFATMGAKFFVDARAAGEVMGATAKAISGKIDLTLAARGTRPITDAVLIRDGEEIYRARGSGQTSIAAAYRDEGLSPGTHWYYWRIAQEKVAPVLPGNLMPAHGHLAWSTPNWVVVE